jgi:hypothetical protein
MSGQRPRPEAIEPALMTPSRPVFNELDDSGPSTGRRPVVSALLAAPLLDQDVEDADVRDRWARWARICRRRRSVRDRYHCGTWARHRVLFGCVDAPRSGVVKVNSMRLWVFFPIYDFRYGQLIGESRSYCPAACLLNIRNSVLLGDPTRVVSLALAQFVRRLIATVTATAANQ